MKRLVSLAALAILPVYAQHFPVKEEGGRPVELIGYKLNDSEFTLIFKATDRMNVCLNQTGKNAPFVAYNHAEKQYVKRINGVSLCPKKSLFNPGNRFSVVFPAPGNDNAIKTFSFIEGNCGIRKAKGCWRFKNISLPQKAIAVTVTEKDFYRVDNNRLTPADLSQYGKEQLRLLRNYFFAKKGLAFKKDSDLDKFFKRFAWYAPTDIEADHIYDDLLSEQEKDNIQLILSLEGGNDVAPARNKQPGQQPTKGQINKKTDKQLAIVQDADGQFGYQNSAGEWVIGPQFDGAWAFDKNGLAIVEKNKQFGYIDSTGAFVVKAAFDNLWEFADNGLAIVEKDDQYGYVNTRGELTIPPQFDEAWGFDSNGLAIVKKGKEQFYINEKGEKIKNAN
ncbi:MAG: hypothetical protein CSA45_05240 [Gammaproteobacteria bacterium]|nr:MAG: hypothetical protein CSA45_05240 [Gammaproteobacteria bacterium]